MRGGLYGLVVVVVVVATVLMGSWCLDNDASGWSSVRSAFPAGDRRLLYDRVPTRFALVDPAVPWKAVRSCGDRVALDGVGHELVVEDDAFVDACRSAVR